MRWLWVKWVGYPLLPHLVLGLGLKADTSRTITQCFSSMHTHRGGL